MDNVYIKSPEFINKIFDVYMGEGLIKEDVSDILDQMVFENQQMGLYDNNDNPMIK